MLKIQNYQKEHSGYNLEETPVYPTAPTYQPSYAETAPVHPTVYQSYYPETISVIPSAPTSQPYIVNHSEHPPSYAEATSQQIENWYDRYEDIYIYIYIYI